MRRRLTLAIVSALAVVAFAAIGWLAWRDPPRPAIDVEDDAAIGVRYEYSLMTHCGVDFIRFDGRWWEAVPHLDDGNGNPPDGWDNGIQDGTLTLTSETSLRYEAGADREITFEVPATPPPPQLCA